MALVRLDTADNYERKKRKLPPSTGLVRIGQFGKEQTAVGLSKSLSISWLKFRRLTLHL